MIPIWARRTVLPLGLLPVLALGGGCRGGPREEGRAHGPGRGHVEDDETQSFTLVTATHELFLELAPALTAGSASKLAAHVTELSGYRPAARGALTVELRAGDRVASSASAAAPARRGIFTPTLQAPADAGEYRLRVRYEDGASSATFETEAFRISTSAPTGAALGEIRFPKETQWAIPFRVEPPQRQRVARTLTVPATVTADPRTTHALSASAAGRVEWAREGAVTLVGGLVRRGDLLGRLIPAAAGEHWSTLRQESEVARIERQRAAAEHERVSRLVRDGLVAGRRLQEAQTSLAKAEAAFRAARRREGALSGGAGALLPLRAPASGVVVALHVPHGQRVAAGELLAEVASDDQVLLRATVFQLDLRELERVHWARVRRAGSDEPIALDGAALLTRRIVIDPRTLSAPLDFQHRQGEAGQLRIGDLVELTLGVGELADALTVPVGAVVELGLQPYLFVMVTGESFSRRRVRLGPCDGARVAIVDGLTAKERVVTIGGLDLYLSSVAGSLESHQHQ